MGGCIETTRDTYLRHIHPTTRQEFARVTDAHFQYIFFQCFAGILFEIATERRRIHRDIRRYFVQPDWFGIVFVQVRDNLFHSFILQDGGGWRVMGCCQALPLFSRSDGLKE